MGTTLENGVYLPSEGERNCYAGLKTNWEILNQKVADVIALQQAVAGALHREIVESLPTTDIDPNTIYMILSGTSATENVYNEFMYVNNAWELIGTSATDLTNYYTKSEVDGKLLLKANDSDVVHKSGNETITGIKTFSSIRLTANPCIRMYSPDDEWNVQPATAKQSEIRFTDKNSVTISYFVFQHRPNSTEPFRTCWRQQKMDGTSGYYSIAFGNLGNFYPENDITITLGTQSSRWKSVYANNYYYGLNNVEFSTKFVTTDTAQTITGNKTFSSINGVEPSSLSLPSGNASDFIDISSYFSNTGSGDRNSYTAPANGWIYLRLGDISGCQADIFDANNNRMWGQSTTGSVEQITIPILKGQTLTTQWNTSSTVNVAIARFIPCQGNV